MTLDLYRIAGAFAPGRDPLRVRFGKVVSVQANRTITVTIAGDTTQVSGVRYLGSFAPAPASIVTLVTDGVDLFALGHMAADGTTLSPRATRSTDQNIPDASDTAITFDGVNSDQWGAWSAGQATRLTAPVTGRYMAVGNVTFAANGTGWRRVWIERTGTSTVGRVDQINIGAGSAMWLNVTTQAFDMTAGTDYVRLMVRQNSGGGLAALNSSTNSPALTLIYLGP